MQLTFTVYNGEAFFFLFRVFVILQLPKQLNVHARNNRERSGKQSSCFCKISQEIERKRNS